MNKNLKVIIHLLHFLVWPPSKSLASLIWATTQEDLHLILMLLPILSFGVQTHVCNWHHWRQISVDFEKLVLLEAPYASWLAKSNGLQVLQQQWSGQLLPLFWPWHLPGCPASPRSAAHPSQQGCVSITKRCSHHLLANLLSFLSFFWLWVFFALLFWSLSGNRLGCLFDFSCFLRKSGITMNFPLRTASAASHRFCKVVFSLPFVSGYFLLISLLTHWVF